MTPRGASEAVGVRVPRLCNILSQSIPVAPEGSTPTAAINSRYDQGKDKHQTFLSFVLQVNSHLSDQFAQATLLMRQPEAVLISVTLILI
jgi:hypothetical protein